MALDWYYPRPELAKRYLEEFSRRGGVEKVTPKAVQGSIARLRDEQLIYQAGRGAYRVNSSVFANWLRESTPQIAGPSAGVPALRA